MNELYAEALVKAKPTAKAMAIKTLLVVVIALAAFFILFMGQFIWLPVAVLIIIVAVYLFPKFSHIEYEYIFCDGQLDFDRITSGAKRKTMLRIDMENVEMVAQLGSSYLDNYRNIVNKKDFSSGDTDKTYVIIASKEDKQYRILFEPTDKMLDGMYHKAPSKVKKNR